MSHPTIKDIEFMVFDADPGNVMRRAMVNGGEFITVLTRRTGFHGGVFDTETGYRDKQGKFWLASGMFDIREFPDMSVPDAIQHIKDNANTCVGE